MNNKKQLYIIAGCNGAGKTTASFTILPEVLDCKEFINADEIAKGLSPFQPESVAMQAGRIMLARMDELLKKGETFAFETTLTTKSYKQKIEWAQANGYEVTLLFFWLRNSKLAKKRVAQRVSEGGHNIPDEIIERRYHSGITQLITTYMDIIEKYYIFDNSEGESVLISEKYEGEELVFDIEDSIGVMNFITSGRIVYIKNNDLFSYDVDTKELISAKLTKNRKNGNYKIFTSGENVIIKFREDYKHINIISIFENKLKKIFEIKTENDHTYSKIVGLKYFAGTEDGEIEIWNILDKELYNSIKVANAKINYIEENEGKFFIGLVDGTMLITDEEFKILIEKKVADSEIRKICIIEDEIYILISDKRVIKYRIFKKKKN